MRQTGGSSQRRWGFASLKCGLELVTRQIRGSARAWLLVGLMQELHFECNESCWSQAGDLVCWLLMEVGTLHWYYYSLCWLAEGLLPPVWRVCFHLAVYLFVSLSAGRLEMWWPCQQLQKQVLLWWCFLTDCAHFTSMITNILAPSLTAWVPTPPVFKGEWQF